jgi:integrase
LVENTWIVPADRMKAGREHRVPLSARAVAILEKMKASRTEKALPADAFVFPGAKGGRSLSNMTMLKVLERMNDAGDKPRWVDFQGRRVVSHGFRSTFSDWASETTSYPRDVIEMALAHTIKNKAEAAYRRGDLFDKRRDLMAAWAKACTAPAGENVRALKKAAGA